MGKKPTDKKPDISRDVAPRGTKSSPRDDEESIGLMEPMIVSETSRHWSGIGDLVVELATQSAAFKASLPPGVADALATLVRAMNCYYSNLIEGHNTHPVDIERALKNDYSSNAKKRNLQLEAKAHIAVQSWIDSGGLAEPATSEASIQEIHRRFCELLPAALLKVKSPNGEQEITIVPGVWRDRDVVVGQHRAISPGAVPRFMARFAAAYGRLGKVEAIAGIAAAHHRLLWVHPFLDGNGRVARLMSHAMLRVALDTGSLWSISRGLARNEADYKRHLAACDLTRRNDLDGRGNLSEEALAEFSRFFLEIARDQVRFMRELVEPDRLKLRIGQWAQEEIKNDRLPQKSGLVLEALLYRGELPRAEVPEMLSVGDRQARRITSALLEAGVVVSESPKSDLKLTFPARLAGRWMPGLFPDKPNDR